MVNQDQLKGTFDQVKGKLKETWGKLTDDDIALYNGKQDKFFGKLQEKYGTAREEAEKQIKQFQTATSTDKSGSSDKAA